MLKKILKKMSQILGYLKIYVYKYIYRYDIKIQKRVKFSPLAKIIMQKKAHLELSSFSSISNGVTIELSENSCLKLGEYCSIMPFSNIECSKGATIIFGNRVFLNKRCNVISGNKIVIGDNTAVGYFVQFYDHDHYFVADGNQKWDTMKQGEIIIGNNCWIASNAIILKNSYIEDNCLIAAGTVFKGECSNGNLIYQDRKLNKKKILEKTNEK